MKKIILIITCALTCLTTTAQNNNNQLQDNGLPNKQVEDVLPGGHVLHVRLNNIWKTLEDTESLAMSFLSKDIFPPQMQELLEKKNPLLGLLGMNTVGQPINNQLISGMTGIDSGKPLSLTLYPNKNSLFILAVPVSNFEAFSAMLANTTMARNILKIQDQETPGFEINCLNPDLPRKLFISCSKEYAYICSSSALIKFIHNPKMPRVSASSIIQKSLKQHADKDLLTVVDLQFAKFFLQQLKAYETFPPQVINNGRRQLSRIITPQIRLRLMWQLGITDLNRTLDYAESYFTAGYETFFKYLYDRLSNFEGLSMAVNIGEHQQGLHFSIFSKDIKKSMHQLNMTEMAEILTSIPGDRNSFRLEAKNDKSEASQIDQMFISKLKTKFEEKQLDMKLYSYIEKYFNSSQEVEALESKVPWTISFPYNELTINTPDTIEKGATYLFEKMTKSSSMTVLKTSKEKFIEHYMQEAKILNNNDVAFETLKESFELEQSPILHKNRIFNGANADINHLILESSYKTRDFGIFGYDEHEFINRRYLYFKKIDDFLFIEGKKPGKWLTETERLQKRLLSKAVQELLNQVPENAKYVEVKRILQDTDQLLAGLSILEKGLRSELDEYLVKANEVLASQAAENQMIRQIEAIRMPITMMTLNIDESTSKAHAVLLGKLQYPRPLLMDKVSPLFTEYLQKKDQLGGGLIYQTQTDGQIEYSLIQKTDGIAYLVKTAVKSFMKKYSPGSFIKSISTPEDGNLNDDSILLINPNWSWALQF